MNNQWVSVSLDINLDADTAVVKYGASTIYSGAWISDPGLPSQYQGFDFWAEGGSGTTAGQFYVDNVRLEQTVVPEAGVGVLASFGLAGLLVRRRRQS